MELSRVERLILVNQYRILAVLSPDERDSYERIATALEEGFELEYDEVAQHVYPEGLTKEECREVRDTLSMFSQLEDSYQALTDRSGISEAAVRFAGYDGNNETSFLSYAEYLREAGRFLELLNRRDLNSHGQVREMYQRMLQAYRRLPGESRSRSLSREEIRALVDAQRWEQPPPQEPETEVQREIREQREEEESDESGGLG